MNKLRVYLILVIALSLSTSLFSQEKKLTLKDAAYLNRSIFPGSMSQLKWMKSVNQFSYVENKALVKGSVDVMLRDTILRLAKLKPKVAEIDTIELKRFPRIHWVDVSKFTFRHNNKLLVFDLVSTELNLLNSYPDVAANIDISYEKFNIAYTIDNNLFINVKEKQLMITDDEDPGIVNGQSVHRREFGIDKGTFWSPAGNKLAFYRKDERKVTDYPLVDIDTRIAEAANTKYPMAGEQSEYVTLGIYDIAEGKTIFLETGNETDHYLTAVTWGPDENYIYVGILNRGQDHLKMNQYDAKTGKFVKTLFEEKSDKYVEPEHPLYFLKADKEKFVWISERDGFNHLYLYDTEGKMIRQITSGNWIVQSLLGFDEKEKTAYFTGTVESPLQTNTYSVNMRNGKINRLTYNEGRHNTVFNDDMTFFFDIYSNLEVAREYLLLDAEGNLRQVLLENNDPLEDYRLGETTIFTIKANDNTDLYCRMIKPPAFDPEKKYPVIIYVYGGPHAQLISNSWLGGAGVFLNYLAQEGYIVFTMDNRGSANRGREFEQAIFRNVGVKEVEDQMKGVEYLKGLDYIDAERIGVDGWSYGGFMTISMMLKNPGVFKAGAAGGPVIDWKYYEVMYTERYMDTPQDNPEGYKNASLLNNVDSLEGELLVIQGTMDDVVVWQQSLSFMKECISKGKQLDYFVYPGHGHNVRGKDRVHLYRKIVDHFNENL